jgi:tetratricopeptide (TPR) repeat protein
MDTPVLPTTASPPPPPTATPTATSTLRPSPTAEPAQHESATPRDVALLEGDITAIEAAIKQEPWQFENYHYLRSARLELAAQRPLDELDAEIARYDQLLEEHPEDAEAYVERGRAKYLRTVFSGEPAYLEHAIADFDQAIELEPDLAGAYHMRGLAYHLQSLEYIGIAQLESDPADIEKAIRDYDRAIALDPDMTVAYHDRGTAYAHRGWHMRRGADDIPEETFQDLEQAVRDLTSAIELNPEGESTYLNRAFANWLLSMYLGDAGEDTESVLEEWLADAERVIALNPMNMWGYLLRGFACASAQELAEDEPAIDRLESQANEDFEAFEELGEVLLQEYELSDLLSRIPTLSSGPPIDPRASHSGLLGTLEDDVYASPDGSFNLHVPDLMQPNAKVWDEMASSGDLLVWFEDDLARWYALQVHPGSLAEQSLGEWVAANVAVNLDVQEEYPTDIPLGTAIVLVHRYPGPEADCSTAVVHRDEHFYAASYCLLDHYAGEGEESSIRTFGELYGIKYEPVDALAEEFIRGLGIPSQR